MAYLGNTIVNGNLKVVNGIQASSISQNGTAVSLNGHNHDGRYVYWAGSTANNSAWTWGTLTTANGYTQLSHLASSDGGEIGFAHKSGQLHMQLDGYIWQNEGRYRCLDTSDSSSFAAASHSHSYLPLAGGTLTGAINTPNNTWCKLGDDASIGDHNVGGKVCIKTQTSTATGIAFFNSGDTAVGTLTVNNEFNFDKTIKQSGTAVSLSNHTHSYLPLSGGTLTGNLTFSGTAPQIYYNGSKANYSLIRFIDNASDTYGNGISIGGGGAVIIGGGEAATTMQDTVIGTAAGKGGSEILVLCGDGNVDISDVNAVINLMLGKE